MSNFTSPATYAKEIDLVDQFSRVPGSVKLTPRTRRLPIVDRTPLKDLGMQPSS